MYKLLCFVYIYWIRNRCICTTLGTLSCFYVTIRACNVALVTKH